MWWGGFSEPTLSLLSSTFGSLNPHVVGRFFRVVAAGAVVVGAIVLIPMWWGGFSESGGVFSLLNSAG